MEEQRVMAFVLAGIVVLWYTISQYKSSHEGLAIYQYNDTGQPQFLLLLITTLFPPANRLFLKEDVPIIMNNTICL